MNSPLENLEVGKDGFNNGLLRDPKNLVAKAAQIAEELSAPQREFCHAMMTAESATAAAIAAGYSPKTAAQKACNLLTDPSIIEYIGVLMLLRAQAVSIDAAGIISLQLNTYYEAMQAGDLKAANTALDQLAKMNGLYNRTISTKLPTAKEIKNQSKEEAVDEIAEMTALINSATSRKSAVQSED